MNLIEGGCFIFSALLGSLESNSDEPKPQFEWVQAYISKGKDIV